MSAKFLIEQRALAMWAALPAKERRTQSTIGWATLRLEALFEYLDQHCPEPSVSCDIAGCPKHARGEDAPCVKDSSGSSQVPSPSGTQPGEASADSPPAPTLDARSEGPGGIVEGMRAIDKLRPHMWSVGPADATVRVESPDAWAGDHPPPAPVPVITRTRWVELSEMLERDLREYRHNVAPTYVTTADLAELLRGYCPPIEVEADPLRERLAAMGVERAKLIDRERCGCDDSKRLEAELAAVRERLEISQRKCAERTLEAEAHSPRMASLEACLRIALDDFYGEHDDWIRRAGDLLGDPRLSTIAKLEEEISALRPAAQQTEQAREERDKAAGVVLAARVACKMATQEERETHVERIDKLAKAIEAYDHEEIPF